MNDLDALRLPASYDHIAKREFHRVAAKLLQQLKRELNGIYGDGKVRHNQGGIAVSGEITLHLDCLYVQVSQFAFSGPDNGVMFRSCNGQKDYTGGANNFATFTDLVEPAKLARIIQTRVPFSMKRGMPA